MKRSLIPQSSDSSGHNTRQMSLVDAIYFRFLGRDLFGKAMPGLLLLSTCASALTSPAAVMGFLGSLQWPGWLALLGQAWLAGFALQHLGRALRLIRYYPDPEWFLRSRMPVLVSRLPDSAQREIERAVVLKESCGNAYVSILLSATVAACDIAISHTDWLSREWPIVTMLSVITIIIVFSLVRGHFENVVIQYNDSLDSIGLEMPDEYQSLKECASEALGREPARRDLFRFLTSRGVIHAPRPWQ
jgi:hypothetical protein